MWDSVPWFVGGGAEHSPEVARLLAYAATSGSEGVVNVGDLKVLPLSVPGAGIRVAPGGAVIRNRAAGGTQQTYVGRNPDDDIVNIAATGSGAGRSDLIVARVMDPFMPGEPFDDPADPRVGPYIDTVVVSNVAAGTTVVPSGMSAIPLARLDIPKSTGTITADMIKPLRKLSNPRRERTVRIWAPNDPAVPSPPIGDRGWFPLLNEFVYCPSWATRLRLIVTISQLRGQGDIQGHVRAEFGWNGGSNHLDTQDAGLHWETAAGTGRSTIQVAGTIDIPDLGWRDKMQYIRTGTVINPGSTGQFLQDQWTTVTVDCEFEEAAI